MWEFLTWKAPYEGMHIDNKTLKDLRPNIPDDSPDHYTDLMKVLFFPYLSTFLSHLSSLFLSPPHFRAFSLSHFNFHAEMLAFGPSQSSIFCYNSRRNRKEFWSERFAYIPVRFFTFLPITISTSNTLLYHSSYSFLFSPYNLFYSPYSLTSNCLTPTSNSKSIS